MTECNYRKEEITDLISELNSDDIMEVYNYLQPKINLKNMLQTSSKKWFINETNKNIITDILDNQKKMPNYLKIQIMI